MPPALPLAPQCYPPGAELLHGPPGLTLWYPAGPLIHPALSSSRGGWLSPPPCSHLPTVPHGLGNLAGPPGAPRPLLPPPAHPLGGPFGGQRDVGNAQSVCGVCRRRGVRFSRPRASRRDPGPPPGCAASCAPLSQRCSQCVRVPPPAPPSHGWTGTALQQNSPVRIWICGVWHGEADSKICYVDIQNHSSMCMDDTCSNSFHDAFHLTNRCLSSSDRS